jgi:hypothetical protein
MTPNQRDVFLYSWAQKRKRGRLGNALLCAGIGAAGGLLFGFMMMGDMSATMASGSQASPSVHSMSIWLGNIFKLFGLAVPAFALLMAGLGDRVFQSNEAMYQNMLAQGAAPPTQKPTLKAGERGPQIAVLATVVVIAVFIIVVAVMYG